MMPSSEFFSYERFITSIRCLHTGIKGREIKRCFNQLIRTQNTHEDMGSKQKKVNYGKNYTTVGAKDIRCIGFSVRFDCAVDVGAEDDVAEEGVP
jgi:hypothetical protein